MKHVESLFFGRSNHLFGMYHPATGSRRNHGVVICAPLFHEYYRSHYAIKRIAAELSSKGYDVLRFDYSGMGDSVGELPRDLFNTWSSEIGDAMTEIRELSGCTGTTLITLRFGASLALPWQDKADRYICWDAIPDHRDYADQLDKTNSAVLAEHATLTAEEITRHAMDDYLGTGLSRISVSHALAEFAARSDVEWRDNSSARTIDVQSDTDWVSASLKRIYAHETVSQVVDALQANP